MKKINKKIIIIILIVIVAISFIAVKVGINKEYKKCELKIKSYDIAYCKQINNSSSNIYKIYELKPYFKPEYLQKETEKNKLWSKNKFYEYIMNEFEEMYKEESKKLEKNKVYYFHKNGEYWILDIENEMLLYFRKGIFSQEENYKELLGIKLKNFKYKEIYSIRCGPQNDGTDYYVYKFTPECSIKIKENLEKNHAWTKEKLDDKILNSFKYNNEVSSIENAYFYYRDVNRGRNISNEITGYETGIFDIENNTFYYYYTTY